MRRRGFLKAMAAVPFLGILGKGRDPDQPEVDASKEIVVEPKSNFKGATVETSLGTGAFCTAAPGYGCSFSTEDNPKPFRARSPQYNYAIIPSRHPWYDSTVQQNGTVKNRWGSAVRVKVPEDVQKGAALIRRNGKISVRASRDIDEDIVRELNDDIERALYGGRDVQKHDRVIGRADEDIKGYGHVTLYGKQYEEE